MGSGACLPAWWPYPARWPAGHPWGPGLVIVAWHPCDCPGALAEVGTGHQVVRCGTAECTSAWFRPRYGLCEQTYDRPGSSGEL